MKTRKKGSTGTVHTHFKTCMKFLLIKMDVFSAFESEFMNYVPTRSLGRGCEKAAPPQPLFSLLEFL